MDLLKPFKAMRKRVKNVKDKDKKKDDEQLSKWVQRFETAKYYTNPDLFDEREAQFLGTRLVDRNVNTGDKPRKNANNIYNICFEFIESQVNSQIPQPNVRSKLPGFEAQAESIQQSITNDLKEIGIEQVNDYNERMTPMHGYSVMIVDWDPDFKHHLYRGEIKVTSKHPKQIIPQPGVWDIQRMDYFFIVSGVTKDYIKRRYGKDVEHDKQQYPEYNTLNGLSATISQIPAPKGLTATGANSYISNDLVTEIVCFYRDDDGDIGKFVWVDQIVCENLPKYYYRRMQECHDCGHMNPQGVEKCLECESKKLNEVTTDKQKLDQDVIIHGGEVLPAGTEIPYFMPTQYPITVRKNVPKSFSFEGQSDIDIMRDQQDSIKKIGTKMEEKVIKSGAIVTVPDDLKVQITNETYQLVRGTASQLALVGIKDMSAPIGEDLEYIAQQRQVVQQMLGITNSFQGLQDTTATSGRAKQIQVQQASGRQQSKLFNKITSFKELFMIMFEFKLAFYDELRPYISKNVEGNVEYGDFDKYKFLVRDAAGELYYCTDFVFSADSGDGLPKDPLFMYEQATQMLQSQVISKVQYWSLLESLNFPNASQFKDEAVNEAKMISQNGPPPSPEQIKVEGEMQKQQADHQFQMAKQQNEHEFEIAKIKLEHRQDLQSETVRALEKQRNDMTMVGR